MSESVVGPDWVEHFYGDLAARRSADQSYVVVNMVASADGAISVEGRTAKLGGPGDHHLFHYLRSLADVILVGAQTVRAERYGTPRVHERWVAARTARSQASAPRLAIVSRSLDLDWQSRLFADGHRPVLIVPKAADAERVAHARQFADVVVAGEEGVDLSAALPQLRDLGGSLVLCEGGPTLNGELTRNDLIDELCLTIAPALVGGTNVGLLGPSFLPEPRRLHIVTRLERDGDVFLRFRRENRSAIEVEPAPPLAAVQGIVSDLDYPMMIVTAADGDERSGCLVGFGTQASISPQRYAVWLSKANHTFGVANRTDVLVVHFLSTDDHDLAELFGGQTGDEVDKFERCDWREGPERTPVLNRVSRWFAGRVIDRLDSGDHVCFLLAPFDGGAGEWSGQLGFREATGIEAGHPA